MTVQVGDKLWHVYADKRRGESFYVEVSRVGRKWAYVRCEGHSYDFGRFDLETFRMDGGGYPSPGRVYRSREQYEAEAARASRWQDMRDAISRAHLVHRGVCIEDIEAAAALLRIELPEGKA